MSGAGSAMDYRISGNFLDQKGIIEKNSIRRIGLGANYNQRLANDRLNLRFNVRGSRADDRFTPSACSPTPPSIGPTQPVFDPNAPTGFYDWPGRSLTSPDNPVAILNLAEEKATTYRSIGNMQAEYSLPWIDGLRANLNLGFDVTRAERENFTPSVVHAQTKTGNGGFQTRFTPTQDEHGARDVPQLHDAASRSVPGRSTSPPDTPGARATPTRRSIEAMASRQ